MDWIYWIEGKAENDTRYTFNGLIRFL